MLSFCEHVHEALNAITGKVTQSIVKENLPGLFSGIAGQLLFLLCLKKIDQNAVDEEFLQKQFNRLQSMCSSVLPDFSFSSGLCGLGWFFEFAAQILRNDEDVNSDIDKYLLKVLENPEWKGEYELCKGLCGIANYALLRSDKASGKKLLELSIARIISLKSEDVNGTFWNTNKTSLYRLDKSIDNEQNLGLAHGIPGVISVLTQYISCAEKNSLKPFLLKSCEWLLAQVKMENSIGRFSYRAGGEEIARLGWCYGDLSNALILYKAGLFLENKYLLNQAEKIAMLAAKRTPENGYVIDSELCHGSSGIYVILSELYRMTNEPIFNEAAEYWLRVLLSSAAEGLGLTKPDVVESDTLKLTNEYGLLTGYSGVGLTLISALHGENDWAKCLLIK